MTTKTITEAQLAVALADATNELRLVVKWDADRRAPAMPRWLRVRLHNALPRIRAILDAEIEGKLADTGLELTTAVVNPLDVERLARALEAVRFLHSAEWEATVYPGQKLTKHGFADAIAAEYARLTSSPTAEEDPSDPEHAWRGTADEWRHDR